MTERSHDGDRVRLRPYRESDLHDLAAGCADPLTLRFISSMPQPYTREDAAWWIGQGVTDAWATGGAAYAIADPATDRLIGGAGLDLVVAQRGQAEIGYYSIGRWLAGERADLVIMDAATGAPVGDIGLYYDDPRTGQATIGYAMLPAWRGRGLPTRAVRMLAGWAFTNAGIGRLSAGTLPGNAASQRVLEKAGFRREGYLRGRLPGVSGTRVDDVLYGMHAADRSYAASAMIP